MNLCLCEKRLRSFTQPLQALALERLHASPRFGEFEIISFLLRNQCESAVLFVICTLLDRYRLPHPHRYQPPDHQQPIYQSYTHPQPHQNKAHASLAHMSSSGLVLPFSGDALSALSSMRSGGFVNLVQLVLLSAKPPPPR